MSDVRCLIDPIPNPSPAGEGSPNAQATAAASAVESSPFDDQQGIRMDGKGGRPR